MGVGGGEAIRDDSAEILFHSFLQEALVISSGMGRCPLFDVVHTAFSLPTTASPTVQGALKDGFGKAVVACDIPEPTKSETQVTKSIAGKSVIHCLRYMSLYD